MTISVGEKLPGATLLKMGPDGPEPVELDSLTKGRKVVIFALPGAYTGTCTTSHVPSFIRTRKDFAAKGVDEVICISVNDPFVMGAWGEATGASDAGITMLGDTDASFTKAMGRAFSAPPAGLLDRSKRYALYAEDGVIKVLHEEESPGVCDTSGGESMLKAIGAEADG
ncbi:thiol peroxidase [Defluviimonas sp. 20V17]|uniref:Glutathione-dependent peroxiredoxin n=1 Tax=Allgaiera indica TaxID=765699 RepID=A0AAN4ZYF3_9RHOB|nr:peroxiredoxin [Allgaiera indica]KDB03739.1 thiol peroxidase [Defluviimonas sp. 20V17]GHD99919.1 peroxiredoxin [Allgaiera indica]SDW40654.1 thiol peroxidase (atypical 2-Cys peroxiredoxin) [Allgaiera indica]